MSLKEYKEKRDFEKTPEPGENEKKSKDKELAFVVQRHKARRLHYDLRLESKGVLKSWAIPKGPSMNPKDKRLAMFVEDHPFDYRTFEGVIPEGNYGAGIVEIWDEGTYKPLTPDKKKTTSGNKVVQYIKDGVVKFVLEGKKLKGEFALIKLKNRDDNSWLLIKDNDEYAVHENYDSEYLTPASSPINKELQKNKGRRHQKEDK
jgi:bifunctional non-homologous end joining protein LigD